MIISNGGTTQIDMSTIQQFNINSDIDSTNASDTTSNFNIRLDIDWYSGIDRIAIGDIAVPKTYYVINSSNNTFIIRENATFITVTINKLGNYNINQFVQMLNTINNVNGISFSSVPLCTYTFAHDPISGKLTVSRNAGVAICQISFQNTLYEVMGGYAPTEARNISLREPNTVYEFPYVYNLNAYNNMYLLCDLVSGNNSQSSSNILCALYPHETTNFSYAVDEFDILSKSKLIAKKSDVINFRIVDQFKNPVDFNGIAVSFSLYLFKLKK